MPEALTCNEIFFRIYYFADQFIKTNPEKKLILEIVLFHSSLQETRFTSSTHKSQAAR